MGTGLKPFGSKSNYEIIMGVANGNGLRPEYPDFGMPAQLWDLLTLMWDEEPNDRPLCDSCASTLAQMCLEEDLNQKNAELDINAGSVDNHETMNTDASDWEQYEDETTGVPYYYNRHSGQSTWTKPFVFTNTSAASTMDTV